MVQQRQQIDQSEGRVFHVYGVGIGLFAQFETRRVHENRDMRVHRRGQAEQPLQIDLTWRRVEQIDPADDLDDALIAVIEYGGQVVSVYPVAPEHDKVSDVLRKILRLHALECVIERDGRVFHQNPKSVAVNPGLVFLTPAETRINRRVRVRFGYRGEIFAGARAGIKEALRIEPFECRTVDFEALALIEDTPVPLQTEGFEGAENPVGGVDRGAKRIDIVDPQKPLALL